MKRGLGRTVPLRLRGRNGRLAALRMPIVRPEMQQFSHTSFAGGLNLDRVDDIFSR